MPMYTVNATIVINQGGNTCTDPRYCTSHLHMIISCFGHSLAYACRGVPDSQRVIKLADIFIYKKCISQDIHVLLPCRRFTPR